MEVKMPSKVIAECPCCGRKAKGKNELEELFGWRNIDRNKTIPQSYCRICRSAKCKVGNPKH